MFPTRTIVINGTTKSSVQLGNVSRDFVSYVLRATSAEVIQAQDRQGNPITALTVDNSPNKPLALATRRVQALFGNLKAKNVMLAAERWLRHYVGQRTVRRSGNLQDLWQWKLYRKGQKGITVTPQSFDTLPFLPGDRLALVPMVDYAGQVNARVKNRLKRGFMAEAATAVRRDKASSSFYVYAGFTRAFAVPGETWPHGTPYLNISPRRKV